MTDTEVIARLNATIMARKQDLEAGGDPAASYTMGLLAKGPAKCAEKFGEEAVEAIIEAARGDPDRLATECADVIYHMLVMLAAANAPLDDVFKALAAREGVSGLVEKAARGAQTS